MSRPKLYGISNCDSVRAAKKWLTANDIEFDYIDFRKDGMTQVDLAAWNKSAGLAVLLNKRGTTWRKLAESQQAFTTDEQGLALLKSEPTLIKRPVLEANGEVTVGFKEALYAQMFNA